MRTDKITVTDLFQKQRRYLVPLFQRGYVWTLIHQLQPLWRDIVEQAELQRILKAAKSKANRKHFLGAVVFNQVDPGVKHVPISEVIDGQQRLTTLQVMLVAFRDAVAPLDNEFLSAKLKMLTENAGPFPSPTELFKVWPTNAFRDEFQSIVTAGGVGEVRKRFPLQKQKRKWLPRPLLAQGYLFFHEAITRYLKGEDFARAEDDSDDLLEAIAYHIQTNKGSAPSTMDKPLDLDRAELLLETISSHVQLVEIGLEGEDDPQIIFETLNARGAPLKPADLVRNFVFLYATRKGEDVSAIYESSWKDFDELPAVATRSETGRFWKDTERQGRLRSSRLDLFLFHFIASRTGNELKLGHIFQEFRDWWESTKEERVTARELDVIRKSASVFRELIAPNIKSRFGVFAYRLKMIDTMTVYPLVLLLAERRLDLPENEFDEALQCLESYLVRRAICGLTPKNYNRVFQQLMRAAKAASGDSLLTVLRDELVQLSGDAAVWPDDEAFERSWLHAPVYERLRSGRARMVLEALEAEMHTAKQEYLPIDDPLEKPLSVEHVMPQWGNAEDWPKPPPNEDGSSDLEAIERRTRLMHSFGNLTLLTQPLNSSVSNGPFPEKRQAITGESLLKLNAYFQLLPGEQERVWDLETIINRGRELFGIAKRVWPRPR